MRYVLIIDNNRLTPCNACYAFREHVQAKYRVLVRTHDDLPKTLHRYSHIVLTGGSGRLDEEDESYLHLRHLIREAVKEGVPLLGICFGHQAIAAALGGSEYVNRFRRPTTGWVKIERIGRSRLLNNLPHTFYSFEHHFNDVNKLPEGFIQTATSLRNPIEAFEHTHLPIFGVQFHPEISQRRSKHILREQLMDRMPGDWWVQQKNGRLPQGSSAHKQLFENFYNQSRVEQKELIS